MSEEERKREEGQTIPLGFYTPSAEKKIDSGGAESNRVTRPTNSLGGAHFFSFLLPFLYLPL
jgi:hypothetical protein